MCGGGGGSVEEEEAVSGGSRGVLPLPLGVEVLQNSAHTNHQT